MSVELFRGLAGTFVLHAAENIAINLLAANATNKGEMCTLEKLGSEYLLTLTGDDEHRLNPVLLESIRRALAFVREDSALAGSSTALVTASVGKFFCNGLDVDWTLSSPADRVPIVYSALERTVADYISLPMPTIAAVTGHATGVGFGLVLCHDYVLMRSDRGFFYMSELDIGMPLPPIRLFAALHERARHRPSERLISKQKTRSFPFQKFRGSTQNRE